MLSKLLPVLMLIIGVGAGAGAGLFLAPDPDTAVEDAHDTETEEHDQENEHTEDSVSEFVKLNNQFVIPIVQDERVSSLVVLSLSLETQVAMRDVVFEREPKLRDAFLRVLFDHANMGGFNGSFTQSDMLKILRSALRDVARRELGPDVESVLITDISRQDT